MSFLCIIRRAQILKGITDEKWIEYMVFDDIQQCIFSINRTTLDSGWYTQSVIKIKSLKGSYVVRKNGNLIFDKRIRQKGKAYIVEHLNFDAYCELERNFSVLLNKSEQGSNGMKTYQIEILETYVKNVSVQAENEHLAIENVRRKYSDGNLGSEFKIGTDFMNLEEGG